MKLDVCVRGAGIVGKTAALLLAQQGFKVGLRGTQRRQQTALSATGKATGNGQNSGDDIRAYALNTRSRQLLEQLKAWPAAACPVESMRVYGDGESELHFQQNKPQLAHIADAIVIEARLDDALQYQSRVVLLDATPHDDDDNGSGAAPLTLICEGGDSSTRQALGIAVERHSYGQTALAARLRVTGTQPHTAYQWFNGGDILALLPRIDGNTAAVENNDSKGMGDADDVQEAAVAQHYALVWSVAAERAQALRHLPADAFASAVAQFIAESGGLEGSEGLPDVTLDSAVACWPLRLSQAARWTGRFADGKAWVLAGDAAHTMHPLAGQGLNCGLADIACLAETLEKRDYFRELSDMRVLRGYERAQKAHWQSLRDVTDGLQRLFAGENARLYVARNWGMNRLNEIQPLKKLLVRQAMGI